MFRCIFSLVILSRIIEQLSNFFLNNDHSINAMVLLSNKLFIIIGNSSFSTLISEKIINHKFFFSKFIEPIITKYKLMSLHLFIWYTVTMIEWLPKDRSSTG